MAVFSRYNPRGAGRGGVLLQAHPNAETLPWKPHTTTTRTDPAWGGAGRVHRVGPHERSGMFMNKSTPGSWLNGTFTQGAVAAPTMSSGCGGACGGCGGNRMPLAMGTGNNKP